MRKLLVMIAAALLGGMAMLSPALAGNAVVYDMVGSNPGETHPSYKGTVTLETTGQMVKVTWLLADGSKVTGAGIASGDTMAVGYPSGKTSGIGLYARAPATEVVTGYWSVAGSSTLGTERWTLRR